MDANDMGGDLQGILLIEAQIQNRLTQMAAVIDQGYVDHGILLMGMLRGAVMVTVDLAHRLYTPVAMDWTAVSSYGSGTKSPGATRILRDLDISIKDRHILIVEDVINSGLTLSWLESNLRGRGCASLNIAALLCKPDAARTITSPRYVDFDIPNEFAAGYGLDYAEKYRNLPFVGLLAPHVYEQLQLS